MSKLNYINYPLSQKEIFAKLYDKKQINIFIDLNSISKGFYNRTIILQEFNHYIDTKSISNKYIVELKEYLTKLYDLFKSYNPKFILFYDSGITQNSSIDSNYKANRINSSKSYIQTDDEKQIYYLIKDYYFNRVNKLFRIKNNSTVVFLDGFETDFVPYFIIKNCLINSDSEDTLNLILSVDKDLLQTCFFKNTYQSIALYLTSEKRFIIKLYDNINSISYITKSDSKLTSDYIPILLSLSGDKVDNIAGIYGIGPIKAEKLIISNKMEPTIYETTKLPPEIHNEKDKLIKNFKLISFEEQITRLPISIYKKIKQDLEILGI